jgi:hypothetical protein
MERGGWNDRSAIHFKPLIYSSLWGLERPPNPSTDFSAKHVRIERGKNGDGT